MDYFLSATIPIHSESSAKGLPRRSE
jgi:hypothetical protein